MRVAYHTSLGGTWASSEVTPLASLAVCVLHAGSTGEEGGWGGNKVVVVVILQGVDFCTNLAWWSLVSRVLLSLKR